jgi:hypothetical protein
MTFKTWLDTFVAEKGLDLEHTFEVPGASGPNFIPLAIVVDAMKGAPAREQAAIKAAVVKIDFMNGKVLPFFAHLAQALAI